MLGFTTETEKSHLKAEISTKEQEQEGERENPTAEKNLLCSQKCRVEDCVRQDQEDTTAVFARSLGSWSASEQREELVDIVQATVE